MRIGELIYLRCAHNLSKIGTVFFPSLGWAEVQSKPLLRVWHIPLSVVPPQAFLGVVVFRPVGFRSSSGNRPAEVLQGGAQGLKLFRIAFCPPRLRARLSYHGGSLSPAACGGCDREGGLVSLQLGWVHFREGWGGVPTELLEERWGHRLEQAGLHCPSLSGLNRRWRQWAPARGSERTDPRLGSFASWGRSSGAEDGGCRGGVECEPHYPRGGSPRGRGPLSRVGQRDPREDGHPQEPRAQGLWSVRVWQRGCRRWSTQ